MTEKEMRFPLLKEYYILLLPIFFILHGYKENYPLIQSEDALLLLLMYLMTCVGLLVIFYMILKSWRKSSILVFILLSFHFFFGSAHDAMQSWMGHSALMKYSWILPLSVLFFTALFIYLKRTHRNFYHFRQYLLFLLLVLVLLDAGLLAVKMMNVIKVSRALPLGFTPCDTCSKPDIYLIVADGYAGHTELRDLFQFDNTPFENQLRSRGFQVIENTTSNYNYTPFSIASMLSMNYLAGVEGKNKSKSDRQVCYRLINKNGTLDYLQLLDYQIRNLSVFQLNEALPVVHSSFFLTGKDRLTAQTFLARVNRDIRFNLITKLGFKSEIKQMARTEWTGIQTLLQKTKAEADRSAPHPRFIYTHLMMPHYPYFFDRQGNPNPLEEQTNEYFFKKDKYLGYLQYSNQKFLDLIDYIFMHSRQVPVIVLMSDHGFREFANDSPDHRYHFMNLDAIYLPQKNYTGFYKGMSMVNQFRVLLNTLFSQKLPLLKDATQYFEEE